MSNSKRILSPLMVLLTLLFADVGHVALAEGRPAKSGGAQRFQGDTEFVALAKNKHKVVAVALASTCKFESVICSPGDNSIVVARFTASGKSDRSFGRNGEVVLPVLSEPATVSGVVVREDSSIVVSYSSPRSDSIGVGLLGLTKTGQLDSSFGGEGGEVIIGGSLFRGALDSHRALALLPDGRLILAGAVPTSETEQFGLLALLPNGSVDSAFGTGGVSMIDLGPGTVGGASGALEVQPDGSLLAFGSTEPDLADPSSQASVAAVAVRNDGTLDSSFGNNGVTVLPPGAVGAPFGVAAKSIARVPGLGIMTAPDYGATPCGVFILRSLDEVGNYPGDMFTTGPDVQELRCAELSDAEPLGAGLLAIGTSINLKDRSETPRAVSAHYSSTMGGNKLAPPRVRRIGPPGFPSFAEAQVELSQRRMIVGGAILANRCRAPYLSGFKCKVATLVRLNAEGEPDRRFGQDGVALLVPGRLRARQER